MKSKACEVLGVELDEVFETYVNNTTCECKIIYNDWGDFQMLIREKGDMAWATGSSVDLLRLIEFPIYVNRVKGNSCLKEIGGHTMNHEIQEVESRWTAKDYSDAEMVKDLLRDVTYVRRSKSGFEIQLYNFYGARLCSFYSATQLFPSLEPDEKVKLDEILGGADMNAPESVKSYIVRTQLEKIKHG